MNRYAIDNQQKIRQEMTAEEFQRLTGTPETRRYVFYVYTDRTDQDPDHAPELWTDLDYVDGIRKIPDVITAVQAFAKGELGWRGGVVYRSLQDGNVWLPEDYPAGWEALA